MEKRNFVALVEVKPIQGCFLSPLQVGGAMVRCYVSADNDSCAIDEISKKLHNELFDIVEIEWCVDDSETEWEYPASEEASICIEKASTTGQVIFSEFHTWPPEG